jgi:hypothetical protein
VKPQLLWGRGLFFFVCFLVLSLVFCKRRDWIKIS